jgi:hypothetical protein
MFDKYPSGVLNVTVSKYHICTFFIQIKQMVDMSSSSFFLVEGRKLKDKDLIGQNDPYV